MASRILIQFSKIGRIRYIGHLDLMHVFQRAIKRAKLPISYSQGFNPHQIMSFGMPLSLGVNSESEYVEISLEDDNFSPADVTSRLNAVMPEGLQILASRHLQKQEKTAAAIIEAARYEIELVDFQNLNERLETMMATNEIFVEKKTKSGLSTQDIRPDIFSLTSNQENKVQALLAAGSSRNLKPDLLVKVIYNDCPFSPFQIKYTRFDLLKKKSDGEGFISVYEKDSH